MFKFIVSLFKILRCPCGGKLKVLGGAWSPEWYFVCKSCGREYSEDEYTAIEK